MVQYWYHFADIITKLGCYMCEILPLDVWNIPPCLNHAMLLKHTPASSRDKWENIIFCKLFNIPISSSIFNCLYVHDFELYIANSSKDLPTSLRSTVSAQPRKRATCAEQEVGLSWFSLRQCSNSTNSLEQSCLIFWITGLTKQM